MIVKNIVKYLKMVKFSHTIFALPFALVSLVLIWQERRIEISLYKFLLIILAFTSMRNFAMSFNRIIDAEIDKKKSQNR